jgi:hypothetical protein
MFMSYSLEKQEYLHIHIFNALSKNLTRTLLKSCYMINLIAFDFPSEEKKLELAVSIALYHWALPCLCK